MANKRFNLTRSRQRILDLVGAQVKRNTLGTTNFALGGTMRRTGGAAVLFVALALCLVGVTGCRGSQFRRDGAGSFPPETTYAANDWQYTVDIYTQTSDPGSMYDRQNKVVWVRIEDQKGNRLLNDRIDCPRRAMVIGTATWVRFQDVAVVLSEEGYSASTDSYSVALAKSGPKAFTTLKYRYNETTKQFERVQ